MDQELEEELRLLPGGAAWAWRAAECHSDHQARHSRAAVLHLRELLASSVTVMEAEAALGAHHRVVITIWIRRVVNRI
eukprot:SAG11_NODE_32_length_22830_cov_17.507941_24_plen_78_part_00